MKKYKLALLFGTYDPLHFGHIRLFRRAKELADMVYVATDSDELIISTKSREPFSQLDKRIEDLLDIVSVDAVVIESHLQDKKYWIDKLKPDILIKGDDWKGKKWSGEGLGAEVLYLPYTKEISSTNLRKWLGNI